jgi:alpha-ketoglutarate-dependent taurine dioxygenase
MSHELEVRDLPAPYGVEIAGLDTHRELDDASCAILRRAFDERGLLLFRDLDLSADYQAHLASSVIGQMGGTATGKEADAADPAYVSNKEPGGNAPYGRLLFHSDMMWSEHTFRVLSLYGVEIEQPASPTIFVSATDGWTTMPDDLRAEVETCSAVQGHDEAGRADDPDVLVSTFKDLPTRTTPVGLPHPHTGDIVLYVSQQMTQSIEGLDRDDSEALLERLFSHLYRDEAVYEHDWRERDLVAWDNIAVQHARPNVTLEGPARTLRKVYAPVPPKSANPTRPTYAAAG